MSTGIEFGPMQATDAVELEKLYPAAFPDEDLLPLLRDLLCEYNNVLSFVATSDQAVVGHIAFTICGVVGRDEKVSLLGPLAVSPHMQRRGIGSALVKGGLSHLIYTGTTQVFVLGAPAFYGRFGFEANNKVTPPYALPQEWLTAWQSINLHDSALELQGKLSVPPPWQRPSLWGA
jgi:putative acetyltransferase